MLEYTFKHLKGIGSKKERELWNSGIFSWDDFDLKQQGQLLIFDNQGESILNLSRKSLQKRDTDFFCSALSNEDYYRIALSFPKKTLFLDIETTGLSRYYDHITLIGVSIDNEYKVYIQGEDITPLKQVMSEAKAIVTFNGSLFDIPFIRQEFPDLQIPSTHIDLRFFAKRIGLSGGQKKIEKQIGVKRAIEINNLEGQAAPLLWHKYCRGDIDSLNILLTYNHADIEGMKQIFDFVVERYMNKQQIPPVVKNVYQFSKNKSQLNITSGNKFDLDKTIKISAYQGEYRSIISFKDLSSKHDLSRYRVVGIDLTGSESRPSGWCFLEGNHAQTRSIKTDAEIVEETIRAKPDLISIDSPLSLPKGRLTVDDEDPGRKIYGITRFCERTLKKRGINVYPSLIKSMQGLTARGITLAKYFRSHGIPVIESYPGAAQDIMRIPRKQAGLAFLRDGLAEFGIEGDFCNTTVSHDELDAITSAVVGLFFWSGKYERLGNNEEEYLIIPNIALNQISQKNLKIVGFSGSIASGKTTAAMSLESSGFHYARFSLVLADLLKERGMEPSRESLQQTGIEINKNLGQRWLCQQLLDRLPEDGNYVIDGLRFPEDRAFFVERFSSSFLHIHIDLPEKLRLERFISRGGNKQSFIEANSHLTEANIDKLASIADIVLSSTEDLESLLLNIQAY